jgi:hypothetical protein
VREQVWESKEPPVMSVVDHWTRSPAGTVPDPATVTVAVHVIEVLPEEGVAQDAVVTVEAVVDVPEASP